MLAVADSEDRGMDVKHGRINRGAARIVHAGRTAGDDDAFPADEIGSGGLTGSYFRVHAQIAHFSSDQVAILPTCIKNSYLGLQINSRLSAFSFQPLT